MVDKVKPLKLEETTDGSTVDFISTEADPTQDYLAAKGMSFENQDNFNDVNFVFAL
jgi:hypothetical protein